jgi:hypothetical protein
LNLIFIRCKNLGRGLHLSESDAGIWKLKMRTHHRVALTVEMAHVDGLPKPCKSQPLKLEVTITDRWALRTSLVDREGEGG